MMKFSINDELWWWLYDEEFMMMNYDDDATQREIDPESGWFKPKQDCNYPFPIDLAPNRIPFRVKSIGKG